MGSKETYMRLADMPELISAEQAAQACGVSARHVARMCERGEIRAVKLGKLWRINRDAFMQRMGL